MKIGGGDPNRPWVTVVGIVGNVRHNGITDAIKEKFYVPHTQWHKSVGNPIRGMTLVVKAARDPRGLVNPVRQAIRSLYSSLPVANVRTMDDVVAATLSAPRFTGMLLGVFAALALALSAIGIYGVLSYIVSRRTREIGIRVAIGAGRAEVLKLVLRGGVGLAMIGIVIGLVLAAALSRLMATLLHDVQPGDPATFATVAAVLTAVAVAASLIPAIRATRVDPVRALKAE
jgi:ABC-type antimicrobial peptide transport system permease subunit